MSGSKKGLLIFTFSLLLAGAEARAGELLVSRAGCHFYQLDAGKWAPGNRIDYPSLGEVVSVVPHPKDPAYSVLRKGGKTFILETACLEAIPALPPAPGAIPALPESTATPDPIPTSVSEEAPATTPTPVVEEAPEPMPAPVARLSPTKRGTSFLLSLAYWSWQESGNFITPDETVNELRLNSDGWGPAIELRFPIGQITDLSTRFSLLLGGANAATRNNNLYSSQGSSLLGLVMEPGLRWNPVERGFSMGLTLPLSIKSIAFPEAEDGYLVEYYPIRFGLLARGGWEEGRWGVGMGFGFLQSFSFPMWTVDLNLCF